MRLLLRVFLFILVTSSHELYGQHESLALAKPAYDNLLVNVDNVVYIVAEQKKPVRIDQITAEYSRNQGNIEISGDKGQFIIRPDSVGIIMISIKLKHKIIRQYLRAIEIPATPYLSYHGSHDKMPAGEMRAQRGLFPVVENYGFDIKCKILSFELLRVNTVNSAYRSLNTGGTFNEDSKRIIENTSPGDIYFFYNIICECPGSNYPQLLDDIYIEIEK